MDTTWASKIYEGVNVRPRTFTVLVHGMRVADFPDIASATHARSIETENARLLPDLKIAKTSWLRKVEGLKDYSSMVIEVTSADIANRMIIYGLVHRYSLKAVELFDRNSKLTQCFQCQGYGHTSHRCSAPQKCGFYSGGHRTAECALKEQEEHTRCARCEGAHPAWSSSCPERKKELERVRKSHAYRQLLHPVSVDTYRGRSPPQGEEHTNDSDREDSSWTMVGEKKRKILGRGRPLGSKNKRPLGPSEGQNIRNMMKTPSLGVVVIPDSQAPPVRGTGEATTPLLMDLDDIN